MNNMHIQENPVQRTVELTQALLIYVPPQHKQYHRPFNISISPDDVNELQVSTDEGMNITNRTVSSVASRILNPSATPEGEAYVENGFETPRFAFFLEITYTGAFGRRREIVTGFTNYAGITAQGSLDPNMRFYVNGRQDLGDVIQGTGKHVGTQVMHTDSLLPHYDRNLGVDYYSLRPVDIAKTGQLNTYIPQDEPGVMTINTMSSLNNRPAAADRSSVLPSCYLSRLLNTYREANGVDQEVGGGGLGSAAYYKEVTGSLQEKSPEVSQYYTALALGDPTKSNTFTLSQINARWPRDNGFWQKVMPGPRSKLTSPLEHTEHWHGATTETMIAYQLTHAMPALMMGLMIWQAELTITNQTPTGQISVGILSMHSMFEGALTRQRAQLFERQLVEDLVKGSITSRCNSFNIHLTVNVMNGFDIKVSVNGQPTVPYSAPLFCDSFYSPLIGVGQNSLDQLTDGLENLVGYVLPNGGFRDDNSMSFDPDQGMGSDQFGQFAQAPGGQHGSSITPDLRNDPFGHHETHHAPMGAPNID